MTDLETLMAIEHIRRLKARYCRAMDEKNWHEWREVFTEDGVMLVPEVKERPQIVGIDAIIDFITPLLKDAVTIHHLHAPEIDILGPDEARGIWALDDTLIWPADKPSPYGWTRLRGAGHYREKYRRTPAGWRIAELALTRLFLDRG